MPEKNTSKSKSSLTKSKIFAYHYDGMFSQGYAILELLMRQAPSSGNLRYVISTKMLEKLSWPLKKYQHNLIAKPASSNNTAIDIMLFFCSISFYFFDFFNSHQTPFRKLAL